MYSSFRLTLNWSLPQDAWQISDGACDEVWSDDQHFMVLQSKIQVTSANEMIIRISWFCNQKYKWRHQIQSLKNDKIKPNWFPPSVKSDFYFLAVKLPNQPLYFYSIFHLYPNNPNFLTILKFLITWHSLFLETFLIALSSFLGQLKMGTTKENLGT